MARELDLTNLTDEDIPYIAQRPWLIHEAELLGVEDVQERVDAYLHPETLPFSGPEFPGVEVLPAEGAASTPNAPQTEEEANVLEDDEEDDYEDWKVAELKAELTERGLPSSGVHADLVARLREDDTNRS